MKSGANWLIIFARRYSAIAREQCKLPREAGHFAWLDSNSEAGQAYWMSMNLAGDYAKACHERIHINLAKAFYKNIDRVMDFQKELVDIHGKFMPKIVRMKKE
ncbi:hypothetical protein FACS189413_16930 [Bacteroidia bacterium]|nr:hypothetical protein FACS189413_16930 [Bacteroidia bacterium]